MGRERDLHNVYMLVFCTCVDVLVCAMAGIYNDSVGTHSSAMFVHVVHAHFNPIYTRT